MKTLKPGDTLILKFANDMMTSDITPDEYFEDRLYLSPAAEDGVQYLRQAPVYLGGRTQEFLRALRDSAFSEEESAPMLEKESSEEVSSENADVADNLAEEMKKVIPPSLRSSEKMYANKTPSDLHGTANDFYLEDEDPAFGPTFTLQPPYIQI